MGRVDGRAGIGGFGAVVLAACLAAATGGCLAVDGTDAGPDGDDPGARVDGIPGGDPAEPDVPEAADDVPGTEGVEPELPPAEVQGDTRVDEQCPGTAPSFPSQCGEVSEFQCGFQAECTGGVIHASWHVHHFCSPNDAIEDIVPYECEVTCPHGCQEGPLMDWPPTGQALVDRFCAGCAAPGDCEGQAHEDCAGAWTCAFGQCAWVCDGPSCVAEGDSVAVVPEAPDCCAGLGKVPCDAPDEAGQCQGCDGASVCARCGNGQCGPGENPCNCPGDCTN